jgi:hypothetical protein
MSLPMLSAFPFVSIAVQALTSQFVLAALEIVRRWYDAVAAAAALLK